MPAPSKKSSPTKPKPKPKPPNPLIHEQVLASVLADNTRIAYAQGWRRWEVFCAARGLRVLPARAADVAQFLAETATEPGARGRLPALGTVMLWRSAINRRHVEANLKSPTGHAAVTNVCKGLARLRGGKTRRVKALREHHIKAMLQTCPRTPIGFRDAALIALGFAAALRRSEICGLTLADLEMINDLVGDDDCPKMFLHIRQSKTDQVGEGQKIAVPDGPNLRPLTRLKRWLIISEIDEAPLDTFIFQTMTRGGTLRGSPLHHADVARLVKKYARLIGLDPADVAGHSLRAGFVTSAAVHHARLDKIMEVTRHRNPNTVIKYIRDVDSFTDHAGQRFL